MKSGSMFAGLLLACLATNVYADNVWVGPQANAGHTGYVPITTNPAKYHLLWEKKLEPTNIVRYLPDEVILDHTVYYAYDVYSPNNAYLDDVLVAVDTNTGNEKWRTVLNPNQGFDYSQNLYYVNQSLYVRMNDDNNTYLYQFDLQNGKLLHPGLTVESGNIIAADEANFYVIKNDKLLQQLNAVDLSVKWSVPYQHDDYTAVRGYAVGAHYLLEQYDTFNSKIDLYDRQKGKLDASVDVKDIPMSDLIRYPVVDNDSNAAYFVLGRHQLSSRTLFAVDLVTHAIRWSLPNQNGSVNPVVANNVVYSVSSDAQTLNAIDTKSGVVLWAWQLTNDSINTFKPPVVTNDVIFIVGKSHTYAVSLATHQTVWESEKAGRIAVGDNKLFIETYNNDNGSADYLAVYALD